MQAPPNAPPKDVETRNPLCGDSASCSCGATGIRTPDLLLAKGYSRDEARRHETTERAVLQRPKARNRPETTTGDDTRFHALTAGVTSQSTSQLAGVPAPSWRRRKLLARAEGHQVDEERAAFYRTLWGDAEGYLQIAAGLPAADILARGWPLAPDEQPRNPAELGDKVLMLAWTREHGDCFKAAGRPHTAEAFAWPAEARALDRYVAELAEEYDNVYCRKYLAATPEGAKRGEAPAHAQVVQVEDAPAELPADLPPFSFELQTSAYSRQGFYRLPHPLPWAQVERLAGGLARRLGADSGGSNPAQYTRIPTTRNTKARAGRFRVHLLEGGGPVALDELARAALPGGLAELRGGDGAGAKRGREHEAAKLDAALWVEVEGYRGHLAPGGLLRRPDGTLRRPRADHPTARILRGARGASDIYDRWAAIAGGLGRDGSKTGWRFYLAETLRLYGYPQAEARAILEALAPDGGADPRADIDRVIGKVWARATRAPESPTRGYTPSPAPAPWLPVRAPRGRPAGARAAQVERLGELLAARIGGRITRPQLGELLGVGPRAVAAYLAQLRASPAWLVELRALGRGGLLVEKCDRKSPAESVIEASESVIAAPAEDAAQPVAAPIVESVAPHGDHTPPDPPAGAASPAAAGALDLGELVAEWVEAYGYRWRAVRRAAQVEGLEAGAELRRVFDLHPWRAFRLELRGLADRALLRRVKLLARSHQQAVKQADRRRGWYERRFLMADEERRRRGLDLLTETRQRRRQEDFDARKASAAQVAGRLGDQARKLRAEDADGRVQAELWAAVDADRFQRGALGGLKLKGAPPVVPDPGGVCAPPEPAPASVALDLVARLQARKVALCAG